MGTNYYLHDRCKRCQRYDRLHIGKSSAGWVFSLHVFPAHDLNDLDDWKWLIQQNPDNEILDEYDQMLSLDRLLEIITDRSFGGNQWTRWETVPAGYMSWVHFHQINHSEPGPKGLLRHRLDSNSYSTKVIKHGDGTWDCLEGDFS